MHSLSMSIRGFSFDKKQLSVCLFVLIPLFAPSSFSSQVFPDWLDEVFKIWTYCAGIAVLVLFFRQFRKFERHHLAIACMALLAIMLVISTLASGGLKGVMTKTCLVWLATFIFGLMCTEQHRRLFWTCLIAVLGTYVLINGISIIAFPNALFLSDTGMRNWFLGDRNLFLLYILPCAVISILYDIAYTDRAISIKSAALMAIGFFELLYVFSATSLTVFVAFIVLAIAGLRWEKVRKIFSARFWLIAVAAVFVLIVLLRLQGLFEWFIVGVLGKSITLTDRVVIWDYVLNIIPLSPLIGYGQHLSIVSLGSFTFVHAHNLILQILYLGGFISLALLIAVTVMSVLPLSKKYDRPSYISVLGVGCLLMAFNFDYGSYPALFLLLATARAIGEGSNPLPFKFGLKQDENSDSE